jgi:hypothetical protein
MTVFNFTELVNDPLPQIESAALGPNSSTNFVENDVGKIVKVAAASNYVLATAGDEIEGFVKSVEPYTVNDGYSFGSVQRTGRFTAEVGSTETGTVVAGTLVVTDTQAALGTAGLPQVQSGTPTQFLWRCIRIVSGTGASGDKVLLERI